MGWTVDKTLAVDQIIFFTKGMWDLGNVLKHHVDEFSKCIWDAQAIRPSCLAWAGVLCSCKAKKYPTNHVVIFLHLYLLNLICSH